VDVVLNFNISTGLDFVPEEISEEQERKLEQEMEDYIMEGIINSGR
jgi:hypothetical protein